jgi:hypothetical protein
LTATVFVDNMAGYRNVTVRRPSYVGAYDWH